MYSPLYISFCLSQGKYIFCSWEFCRLPDLVCLSTLIYEVHFLEFPYFEEVNFKDLTTILMAAANPQNSRKEVEKQNLSLKQL